MTDTVQPYTTKLELAADASAIRAAIGSLRSYDADKQADAVERLLATAQTGIARSVTDEDIDALTVLGNEFEAARHEARGREDAQGQEDARTRCNLIRRVRSALNTSTR